MKITKLEKGKKKEKEEEDLYSYISNVRVPIT